MSASAPEAFLLGSFPLKHSTPCMICERILADVYLGVLKKGEIYTFPLCTQHAKMGRELLVKEEEPELEEVPIKISDNAEAVFKKPKQGKPLGELSLKVLEYIEERGHGDSQAITSAIQSKRSLVRDALSYLYKSGRIQRVSQGKYCKLGASIPDSIIDKRKLAMEYFADRSVYTPKALGAKIGCNPKHASKIIGDLFSDGLLHCVKRGHYCDAAAPAPALFVSKRELAIDCFSSHEVITRDILGDAIDCSKKYATHILLDLHRDGFIHRLKPGQYALKNKEIRSSNDMHA